MRGVQLPEGFKYDASKTFAFIAVILDSVEISKAFYEKWDFQQLPC